MQFKVICRDKSDFFCWGGVTFISIFKHKINFSYHKIITKINFRYFLKITFLKMYPNAYFILDYPNASLK